METNRINNSVWNTHLTHAVPSMYKKEVIVVDINFLPNEDKINPENIEDKYNKLFEGYIVVFIDSSKINTQQSNSINHPPIYKL